MARFQFRLESILNLKRQLENQARMEMADAEAELAKQQQILQEIRARRSGYLNEGLTLRKGTMNAQKLRENTDAVKAMDELVQKQLVQVEKAGKMADSCRRKLQEIMQDRKAYEKLREHEMEAFLAGEIQQENKEVDELISYRFGNKEGDS